MHIGSIEGKNKLLYLQKKNIGKNITTSTQPLMALLFVYAKHIAVVETRDFYSKNQCRGDALTIFMMQDVLFGKADVTVR
jgi:hypothetical protein